MWTCMKKIELFVKSAEITLPDVLPSDCFVLQNYLSFVICCCQLVRLPPLLQVILYNRLGDLPPSVIT